MSTLASLDIEWAFENVWTSSGGPDVKGFTFKKLSLEGTEYFRNRWSKSHMCLIQVLDVYYGAYRQVGSNY